MNTLNLCISDGAVLHYPVFSTLRCFMAKSGSTSVPAFGENVFAKKALEAVAAIDRDAHKKKMEQVATLNEAMSKIDERLAEMQHQKQEVQDALDAILGTSHQAKNKKHGRGDYENLRDRVTRWLSTHSGTSYTTCELQAEFPELKPLNSVATFLKKPIEQGVILIDRSGGNRNTRYSAGTQVSSKAA